MHKNLELFLEQNGAKEPLRKTLLSIARAGAELSRQIARAGIIDITGAAGTENVQGEAVQKLDLIANEQIIAALEACGAVAGVASEEEEKPRWFEDASGADRLVMMDPLDGSSNIDVNIGIGTIFAILERKRKGKGTETEFLRPGNELEAAGYILFGTATILVCSWGKGVHSFVLDPSSLMFIHTQGPLRLPDKAKYYSVNESNIGEMHQKDQDLIHWLKAKDGAGLNGRYIGSMVADVHRNLLKGGIFIYPATQKAPQGKLRLLYECNPMAFLYRDAGGAAFASKGSILDIKPESLHQRTPIFLGNIPLVAKAQGV